MSRDPSDWAGARWWKFDVHTHTPASNDYTKDADQARLKELSPQAWLLDFMSAKIDCIVVTDHNSGAWLDRLHAALAELQKAQPKGYRPMTIFPGVEISANGGVHVLAVLDPSCETADVDSLLGAVGYGGTKGASDAVTSKSVVDVLQDVHAAGGIAIPAHVDKPSGLFQQQTGTTLKQACMCDKVSAMELVDPSSVKPRFYLDAKLDWTEVLGSDAHHPSGTGGERYPGSHFTWVKMGQPSLDGLRLALLDGPMSVKRSDTTPTDPNAHASLTLESFEVLDARYLGRGTPLSLGFSPWLNAIIGGRGTGKSTIVELMRLALRRRDEIPPSLAGELAKYEKVYADRDDDGLLTDKTTLVVTYRKDGSRFRVQWATDGAVEPILEQTEAGEWSATSGEIASRFPVRIYSQKQVYQLAKAPGALLHVIDDAAGVGRKNWDERWRDETHQYLALRANARKLASGLDEEQRLRGELDDIKRKLSVFEHAGHADVLKSYQLRRRQHRVVETWEQGWDTLGERIRQLATDMTPDALQDSAFNDELTEDSALRAIAEDTRDRIGRIQTQLAELARDADDVVADWKKKRDASVWKAVVASSESAYDALKTKLADEGAGDPAAYGRLVQDRQGVEQRLERFAEQRAQVGKLDQQARESADRLGVLRRELTSSRERFLNEILRGNQYVKIAVVPYGAKDSVEPDIRHLIGREAGGFEKDLGSPGAEQGLLAALYDGNAGPDALEPRIKKLKADMRAIATASGAGPDVRDQRFATHLSKLNPEALDRLDFWFPEDSLDVQYSTSSDGQNFRSIQEGSPGQKTAALLAFLLSYGEEPLILDQPEDDLDNHLIYDLIVTQLRQVKTGRQLIVVTHNPNIVVNGDAEQVVALQPRGGQSHKEAEGCLQDRGVRKTICTVMEGGRTAFERRYRRIFLGSCDD